jgi:small subunit ribosomal protein S15
MKNVDIISEFGENGSDTGSSSVQVAILTQKIRHLTEHLRVHRKDFHSRRGLVAMANRRRKLLSYMKLNDQDGYNIVIQKLNLRK